MRFSSYINNQKCLEWGLNANQGALFDLLNQAVSWASEIVVDGVVYYWVSRHKVIEELPLFYKTADTVYRHFAELNDKGLIVYLKQGKHGDKDLIRLTEKGKTWNEFKSDVSRDNSEINPSLPHELGNESEITRKQIRDNSEINPTDNITNNKNTTDHNNKKTTQKSEDEILLEQFGVTGQLAKDFIALRKAKKAPITETALKLFNSQARKVNLSMLEAVQVAISRNWAGFREDWYLKSLQQNKSSPSSAKPSAHNDFNHRDYGEQIMPDWAMESAV
ncbi:hypothetical protein [Rodentibacter caecimuris]|uniref:hypothetical protein n=1 Tax=Rodentibacter caecimuris TaxID=1796644 RepID=UPI002248FD9A|nr:hypothetical protein [Rodentibacter heylii]MCX2960325.1 hypothetical protein [Rodentibacter heylii]